MLGILKREMASALSGPSAPEKPDPWVALWRVMTRFDRAKIAPSIALRNAIGISLPLAVAVALGNPTLGTIAAMGALNVSGSDGSDPYQQRAGRMLAASVAGAIAVCIGGLTGGNDAVFVSLATGWAFAAGMLVALDSAAADIGLISLVTLVVFSARPMTPTEVVVSGLLAFGGGLLQTSLSLALWPVRRHEPEQRAIGDLYIGLSQLAAASIKASEAPPASAEFSQAHKVFSGAVNRRSNQGERYWSLLSQAERIRLSLFVLDRIRVRLAREPETGQAAAMLDRGRELSERILADIGEALVAGQTSKVNPEPLNQLSSLADSYRDVRQESGNSTASALVNDAQFQVDALAGQLRAAMDLAAYSTKVGRTAFDRREAQNPWRLRIVGSMATLSANLSFDSAVFRHAVRLSLCVGLGDLLARMSHWQRSYWLPMTVAIVLKPDFSATFSRGLLRLAGTFVGLLLATALFHLLPLSHVMDVVLIAVTAFVLRCYGPANYGILVIAISALVVILFAMTGIAPNEVIATRGLHTLAGGLLAVAAYAVWPTWERTQLPEAFARMLDAYREYFRGVRESYTNPDQSQVHDLDQRRLAGRLARSNVEASFERFMSEPRTDAGTVALLNALLASSHRLAHAVMALEAGLARSNPVPPRSAFIPFANHIELTLHSLASALRGSALHPDDLPDLRADHHALTHSGDPLTERYALVNVESDRITNSLNTLREQILQWRSSFT